MAQLDQPFDATQYDPTPRFQVLPRDKYPVQIVASEMKSTSAGDGAYLELEMEIIDGPYAGRKVFDRLNLINPNAMAVEIAQRTLSQICHAVGVLAVADSEQLHHKALIADVRVQPARTGKDGKTYDESNEIKGYMSIHGEPLARAGAPAAPATPRPMPGTDTNPPPWRRAKA